MGCCLSICGKNAKTKAETKHLTPNVSFKPCPENSQNRVEFRDPGESENALKSRMSIENENAEIPDVPTVPLGLKESPEVVAKTSLKAKRGSDSMRVVTSIRCPTQDPGLVPEIDSIQDEDESGASESSLEIPNIGNSDVSGQSSGKDSGSNSSFEKIDFDAKHETQSKEWSTLQDDLYNEISTRLGPDQEIEERPASTLQRMSSTETPSLNQDPYHLRPFSVELNVSGEEQKRSSFYTVVGEDN